LAGLRVFFFIPVYCAEAWFCLEKMIIVTHNF
jgi:hypothetical protein